MEKLIHAKSELDQAIDHLKSVRKSLDQNFGAYEALAPKYEADFIPWLVAGLRQLGITEIPAFLVEQSAKSFNVELTQRAGWWLRSCGYTNNRSKNGMRWYDIQSMGMPDPTAKIANQPVNQKPVPDQFVLDTLQATSADQVEYHPEYGWMLKQKETPQGSTDLEALLNNWGK